MEDVEVFFIKSRFWNFWSPVAGIGGKEKESILRLSLHTFVAAAFSSFNLQAALSTFI
jgi:hypothetical protein